MRKVTLGLIGIWGLVVLGLLGLGGAHGGARGAPAPPPSVRFAAVGDYSAPPGTGAVATRIAGWNPAFIITTGDNNYPDGAANTIDPNIGQYYHNYIYPYTGSYGAGAAYNQFFPSLGNHDWVTAG